MQTLGDLRHAHEFDPFDQLRIGASGPIMNVNSLPPGVAMRNWLAAIGLSTLQQQFGSVQLARSFVLKHANGNGRRILDAIGECASHNRQPFTLEEIQESYRRSTLLQTSPKQGTGECLCPVYDEFEPIGGRRVEVAPEEGAYRSQ